MDGYVKGDKLNLSVNNLPELYRLIQQAKELNQQLTKTLNDLSVYDLEINLHSDQRKDYFG